MHFEVYEEGANVGGLNQGSECGVRVEPAGVLANVGGPVSTANNDILIPIILKRSSPVTVFSDDSTNTDVMGESGLSQQDYQEQARMINTKHQRANLHGVKQSRPHASRVSSKLVLEEVSSSRSSSYCRRMLCRLSDCEQETDTSSRTQSSTPLHTCLFQR